MRLANQGQLDWARLPDDFIGKPLMDGKGESIDHIIGRITEAHWENDQIVYTAELADGATWTASSTIRVNRL